MVLLKPRTLLQWLLLPVFGLVVICANAATPASNRILSIRADSWYPVNGDPQSAQPGFQIELARQIFTAHGYRLDYQVMPWTRAVRLVRDGKINCIVGALRSEVPDFVFPGSHWGMGSHSFYTLKGNPWHYHDLTSLKGQKIGLIANYSYSPAFDQLARQRTNSDQFQFINTSDPLRSNIRKLLAHHLTTFVEIRMIADAKLHALGLEGQVIPAGNLTAPLPLYLACSPALSISQDIVRWVDEDTPKLRSSGQLGRIFAQYGLHDFK